jgi:hypothetical protein
VHPVLHIDCVGLYVVPSNGTTHLQSDFLLLFSSTVLLWCYICSIWRCESSSYFIHLNEFNIFPLYIIRTIFAKCDSSSYSCLVFSRNTCGMLHKTVSSVGLFVFIKCTSGPVLRTTVPVYILVLLPRTMICS